MGHWVHKGGRKVGGKTCCVDRVGTLVAWILMRFTAEGATVIEEKRPGQYYGQKGAFERLLGIVVILAVLTENNDGGCYAACLHQRVDLVHASHC